MPRFLVDLWLDGYDTEELMEDACEEFINDQLNMTASSVHVVRIGKEPDDADELDGCPFCGSEVRIFEEGPCGNHPNETWFYLNHSCIIDIELLQKGGQRWALVRDWNTRVLSKKVKA